MHTSGLALAPRRGSFPVKTKACCMPVNLQAFQLPASLQQISSLLSAHLQSHGHDCVACMPSQESADNLPLRGGEPAQVQCLAPCSRPGKVRALRVWKGESMSQPPAKAQKTPKSALMELYQTYRAPPPKFDVISGPPPPAPPNFLCRLSLPGITFNGKTMKEQVSHLGTSVTRNLRGHYTVQAVERWGQVSGQISPTKSSSQECRAEGPNKKAAVHAACLEALRIVDQAGLLPSNINISNGPAAAADQVPQSAQNE